MACTDNVVSIAKTRRKLKKKTLADLDVILDQKSDAESPEVSKSVGLLCALSIPEKICPSTHDDFLKQHSKTRNVKKSEIDKLQEFFTEKNLNLTTSSRTRSQRKAENKLDLTETVVSPVPKEENQSKNEACCSKSIPEPTKPEVELNKSSDTSDPPKENMPKQYQTKFKHWFEDDEPTVIKLDRNKLEINGKTVVVNYNKCTKETDVAIDYDVDEIDPRPLPGYTRPCKKEFCRLGCVCQSIAGKPEKEKLRSRCQNVHCMFGCICFPSTNIDNDGDIRSRLRPRVSLLNWKHSDTYKYNLPSYKELEKGQTRSRRNSTSLSRLRNQNNQNIVDGVQIPKRRNSHNAQHFVDMSRKGNRKSGTDRTQKMVKGRNKKRNEFNSNGSKLDEVSPLNNKDTTSSTEKRENCQPSEDDEYPTILYQKIGTTPHFEDESFLESSINAITSYGLIKRALNDIRATDKIKRQDGKIIFISWTTSKSFPNVENITAAGDHLVLPILPENSEWLIYEFQFEKHCGKSSCISFTDIGVVFFKQFLMFQKARAEKLDKVLKLKLQHHEIRNAKSTINLYILPRVGNIVVLGPVKKSLRETTNVTLHQALSYMEDIQPQNYFGSSHFWDFSYKVNQDTLVESFQQRMQRRFDEPEVLTNKILEPELMEQIMPDLWDTFEEDVPTSFRPPQNHNNTKNLIQLKWSDSMKCSANFHPRVQPIWNTVRASTFGNEPLRDEVINSPSQSSGEETDDRCHELCDNGGFEDKE